MPVSAFILAGEASGDRLAAQLMAAAKGISGHQLVRDSGEKCKSRADSLGGMDSLSIIGFGETLASFRVLSGWQTLAYR